MDDNEEDEDDGISNYLRLCLVPTYRVADAFRQPLLDDVTSCMPKPGGPPGESWLLPRREVEPKDNKGAHFSARQSRRFVGGLVDMETSDITKSARTSSMLFVS